MGDEINNIKLSGDHEEKAVGEAMLENIYFYGNITSVETEKLKKVLQDYKAEIKITEDERRKVNIGMAISRMQMELIDRNEKEEI